MPPESAKFLQDMLDSVNAIEQYTRDAESYANTRALREAVQWNFCIIGEALSQLAKVDAPTANRITDYPKIIALRNQLIHGYGSIDEKITWRIITEHLPLLHSELEKFLAE